MITTLLIMTPSISLYCQKTIECSFAKSNRLETDEQLGGDLPCSAALRCRSEMMYTRQLMRPKNMQERTRLRQAANEHFYGEVVELPTTLSRMKISHEMSIKHSVR